MQRAEEDAHTLTVAVQSTSEWMPLAGADAADESPGHAGIGAEEAMVLTLTL